MGRIGVGARRSRFARRERTPRSRRRLDRYQEDTEASLQMLTASMHGFWWKPQAELLDGYTVRFFDEVRSVFDKRDKEYASRFFGAMYPGQMAPSDHVIARSEALLGELGR